MEMYIIIFLCYARYAQILKKYVRYVLKKHRIYLKLNLLMLGAIRVGQNNFNYYIDIDAI